MLVNARLFDGPVTDRVELAPDHEHGATWDIRGYRAADRPLVLVCEYKNHTNILAPMDRSANRCLLKGDKKRSAWCGE